MLLAFAQISFAQYTFKYESNFTKLEEIRGNSQPSKVAKSADSTANTSESDYFSKRYITNTGDTVGIEPKISVIVKNEDQIDQIMSRFGNKLSFKKKIGRVFIYNCNVKNSDEVLEITTALSGEDEVIGCDAFTDAKIELNNLLYSKQYYLKNYSTTSVGTNVESAWDLAPSLGSNVKVAVIDEGVEHYHEDLLNVMTGFTGGNPSGLGYPKAATESYSYAHGTACAGIIGANNNSIGVRGIASNAKILPADISYTDYKGEVYMDLEYAAEAIVWASERADVLSCSWGVADGYKNVAVHDAIKKALSEGRSGKGCVVVFSTGNKAAFYPNNISFPASVDGVISVGAVDKSGNICDYSQRGPGLCLVAPSGKNIPSGDIATTDRMGVIGYSKGNYTETFSGTSAACPQVAGVAALMLSERPDLTAAEVKDVLQRTARDLGASGYDTTYGYGLLDAYAALNEVVLSIKGSNTSKTTANFTLNNCPANATVTWSVEDADKNSVKLTPSGQGNSSCKVELSTPKTVNTVLTANVKVGDINLPIVKKDITVLGTLSGTYSVPATTISGVSFPAIVNRGFTAGSSLEARTGVPITLTSNDFRYYAASWSGNPVQNWTAGLTTISFSYPSTASTSSTTILKFTSSVGGTAQVIVRLVQPPRSMSLSLEGDFLRVAIIREQAEEISQTNFMEKNGGEEVSELLILDPADEVWTIEVMNTATGARIDTVSAMTGECQFDTSSWSEGIYLVKASNGKDTITKKITIK